MIIGKNDTVVVIAGDDRGKTGKVLKVFPKKSRVIVEKINFVKRHTRPTRTRVRGGVVEKEAPVHVSNVLLLCPKCDTGVRVGVKQLSDGSRVRVCKSCGEMVPRA
ncbi:MAG: 50S ribosomal protein L24 [Candidatus Eisenbacteria bacterium]